MIFNRVARMIPVSKPKSPSMVLPIESSTAVESCEIAAIVALRTREWGTALRLDLHLSLIKNEIV